MDNFAKGSLTRCLWSRELANSSRIGSTLPTVSIPAYVSQEYGQCLPVKHFRLSALPSGTLRRCWLRPLQLFWKLGFTWNVRFEQSSPMCLEIKNRLSSQRRGIFGGSKFQFQMPEFEQQEGLFNVLPKDLWVGVVLSHIPTLHLPLQKKLRHFSSGPNFAKLLSRNYRLSNLTA